MPSGLVESTTTLAAALSPSLARVGEGVKLQAGPISTIGLFFNYKDLERRNIARGTTDPEIDSVTWIKLGNNMAPLTLVANLATRWRHFHQLQIWPPDGATCIV